MKLDIKRNAIRGTIWGGFVKISSLLFPFIIRTIIIRMLGSEYIGLNSLFSSILQVLSLAELGFGSAMVYSMYAPIAQDDKVKQRSIIRYYRSVYLYIGLVILILGLLITPFLKFFIKGDIPSDINTVSLYLIFLFNTVISYFLFSYRRAVLDAYQRLDIISIITFITNLSVFLIQIVLLLSFRNYYCYIICLPIGTLVTNGLLYCLSVKHYPEIYPEGDLDKSEKQSIYGKIRALLLHKIGGIVLNSADNIVISSFLGLTVLALYSNYYYLLKSISSLVMIPFSALTAGIGNSLLLDSASAKKQKFYTILFLNGLIVSVCTCCFFSMYQDFIQLWIGEEGLFSFNIMILFCVYFFIHMIRKTVLMYRDSAGLWKENQFQPIVSAIFNLILNLILVNYIGVYGILISSILAMVLIDIPWESGITTKSVIEEKCTPYYLRLLLFSIITIISCALIHLIKKLLMLNNNIIVLLFIDLMLGGIIPLCIFVLFTIWLPEKENAKKLVFNFLKKKTKTV